MLSTQNPILIDKPNNIEPVLQMTVSHGRSTLALMVDARRAQNIRRRWLMGNRVLVMLVQDYRSLPKLVDAWNVRLARELLKMEEVVYHVPSLIVKGSYQMVFAKIAQSTHVWTR